MKLSLMQQWFLLLALPFSLKAIAEPWQFEVSPYIWAINMNGRVQVADKTAHIDQSFGDILREINFAGMLWLSAKKDHFGVWGNAIYASLSNSGHNQDISLEANSKYGVFGAGISYEIFRYAFPSCATSEVSIEPYAGFRYTLNDTNIIVKFLSSKVRAAKNVNWTDPLIGLRLDYLFMTNWLASLSGDIGGINGSTHYSYSWAALLGYQPKHLCHLKFYLGYRLLDQRYQTGHSRSFYDWNMKLSGPILGFAYSF